MILVYGCGNIGVMREIAENTLKHGGKVIGVMPQHIVDKEVAHHNITELHIVYSMHAGKPMMAEWRMHLLYCLGALVPSTKFLK